MLKPVVAPKGVSYDPVSESELDAGQAHAKKEYGRIIDRDLLRLCVNTTLERRQENRKVILPFLAAQVVRETIPPHSSDRVEKIEACKGAVMKIMSARSAKKRTNDARKRKAGIPVAPVPKQVDHPDDKVRVTKGGVQLILI